jgi:hypothetical protein
MLLKIFILSKSFHLNSLECCGNHSLLYQGSINFVFQATAPSSSNSTTTTATAIVNPDISGKRDGLFSASNNDGHY